MKICLLTLFVISQVTSFGLCQEHLHLDSDGTEQDSDPPFTAAEDIPSTNRNLLRIISKGGIPNELGLCDGDCDFGMFGFCSVEFIFCRFYGDTLNIVR